MKGIVLSGGAGSRLDPLTRTVSKQLLPVYNKPMIYYPLNTLRQMGIREILIITTLQQQDLFKKQLGNGNQWELELSYEIQSEPRGIADAFLIGEEFIGNDDVTLILGDNVFINAPKFFYKKYSYGAHVFGYKVNNPSQYGVLSFIEDALYSVIEKPVVCPSDYACVGLYVFDNTVIEKAKNVKFSGRGELEITSIINQYINEGKCDYTILNSGDAWFDCGTHNDLLECAEFIRALEYRANIKIGL